MINLANVVDASLSLRELTIEEKQAVVSLLELQITETSQAFEEFFKKYAIMRRYQNQFFHGDKAVLPNCRQYEALCDKLAKELSAPAPQAVQGVLL